ncbi:MAG: HD domain-containing protein, partial [Acidimicrobiia bacterium]|nr:HD domain-containing protein [Acidimicrobiia bacterium]
SALALGRRHGFDELHGRQTARLASGLFDALAPELGIPLEWRDVLEDAALVHDVGTQIALKGHDRHGAYLVRHGDLAGFEPAERQMLEVLVRYHRAGTPKRNNSDIAALPEELRPLVRPLVSILRVADGLDRSRSGNVLGLDVRVERRDIVIRLTSTVADPGLDLWGGRRKAELLEKVSGRRVHILGPDEPLLA